MDLVVAGADRAVGTDEEGPVHEPPVRRARFQRQRPDQQPDARGRRLGCRGPYRATVHVDEPDADVVAVDHHRRRERRQRPRPALPTATASPPSPRDDALWDALEALPPKQRSATVLRVVEDLTYRDVIILDGENRVLSIFNLQTFPKIGALSRASFERVSFPQSQGSERRSALVQMCPPQEGYLAP